MKSSQNRPFHYILSWSNLPLTFPPCVMCCPPTHCVHLVLPICTWVPLLEQDSLSGAICPWRKLSLPPQQPSVVNSSCCWEWNFMSPLPCTCWDFGRLDLYRSCARSHGLCEFVCTTALSRPASTVLLPRSNTSGSYNPPSLRMVLEPCGEEVWCTCLT